MYELVSKKEYTPFRKEIEEIIKRVQKDLKKYDKDLTFQFKLIGSGSRHLITRVKGGNAGYDFDYNLIINQNLKCKPEIRENFFNAFQKAIKRTRFNKIENSTSAITIKYVENKKVKVGFDVCIEQYNKSRFCYEYIKLNKEQWKYIWEERAESKNIEDKLENLKKYVPGCWNEIRDMYLKLKNNNEDGNKHSFSLYYEAVNNVCNNYGIISSYTGLIQIPYNLIVNFSYNNLRNKN